ncbi:MAG: alanine--tRNA ligase, partial [Candidatus Brocadiales bacterium]
MKTNEIRKRFLKFFEQKGHTIFPSDSLIPTNDPTLLFTGAGMNQFKNMFLGSNAGNISRAATCQKCLRTGDIENVGRTTSHHTLFEMLGNFSFGDYFKEQAIEWAWEFLLKEVKLQEERLSVSVYENDNEAYDIWQKHIGVPVHKIYKFDEKENYWPSCAPSQGPNGPCGPCSEVFYDQGPNIGCGRKECNPACDCDRYVEIWNLVFIQFDRKDGGRLDPLPRKGIDTGMGLERMARVLQGVLSNFEIDIFSPIIQQIAEIAGIKYDSQNKNSSLMRRIADHARAVVFCISDGVLPSNEGRGYVERRLLRKAVGDSDQLGIKEGFLYKLVPIICDVMQEPYPEVKQRRENIARIIKSEEERFLLTLDLGKSRIKEIVERLPKGGQIPGADAFRLYDTFGIPPDMTASDPLAFSKGLTVDMEGFEREMALQRERSRTSSAMSGAVFDSGPLSKLKATSTGTKFLGYKETESPGKVVAILDGDNLVDTAEKGQEVAIVLDQTPFYAEGGGQIGDSGQMQFQDGNLTVTTTRKMDDIILHTCKVIKGRVSKGESVVSKVDDPKRAAIQRSHSATHLLHHVLRQVIGQHAEQSGSLVLPDRLRFDFNHFTAITRDELIRVEDVVNEKIMGNSPVETQEMSLDEAKASGAIALFGEKYGGAVRVVSIGNFSRELCGGTHIKNTGEIGFFKIVSESSIAAGIRRIEALTGAAILNKVREKEDIIRDVCTVLKAPENQLVQRIEDVLDETKKLNMVIQQLKQGSIGKAADVLIANAKEVSGVKIITEKLEGV